MKANPFLKINRSSIQKTNGTLWSKTSDFRYMPNFTLKFQSIWRQWFYEKIFLEFTNLWFKNQGLRFCTSPWKSFKNTHTWAFGGENDFSKFQVSNFCPLQWNFQKIFKLVKKIQIAQETKWWVPRILGKIFRGQWHVAKAPWIEFEIFSRSTFSPSLKGSSQKVKPSLLVKSC